ncbi:MAG: hypothetical protein R2755_27725 [Acidimicrobiales bacterium]
MASQDSDRDAQAEAEALDASKLGRDQRLPSDAPTYPPERFLGATDPTRDDRVTDSATSRADREVADDPADPDDRAEGDDRAATDDAGLDDLDERPPLRLVADGDEGPDDLLDDEKDLVARALRSDPDDLSAEEAALHLE